MFGDEINTLSCKWICYQCIGEAYLSKEVKREGVAATCSYCGKKEASISIDELSERIETAFEHHYFRTPDQPTALELALLSDGESGGFWLREGSQVCDAIESAAMIPSAAAEDVQAILNDKHYDVELAKVGEETEFSPEAYYAEKGPDSFTWTENWRAFEESLKREARFFNDTAAVHLAAVFGNIDKLRTSEGRPLILQAGPKGQLNHLYRARVFQADDKLEEALCRPDRHLGPPPPRLAAGGRMNAHGISVFYGATVARTAIAEVRPPVGSKVAAAKFRVIKPLRLLNLSALGDAWDDGSIFDPTLKDRLERVTFLASLGKLMTRPVMPDDEAIDYLPTQAIADFLATQNEPRLDGIIYPSVQIKSGRNVVLFHKAAGVEPMMVTEGSEIEASSGYGTDDGRETAYEVTELMPPPSDTPAMKDGDRRPSVPLHIAPPPNVMDEVGYHDPSLRVDTTSVTVHHINWVSRVMQNPVNELTS